MELKAKLLQQKPDFDGVIEIDKESLLREFDQGKAIGEDARVLLTDLDGEKVFSWKRGFINTWTGWPNDGKTDFFTQMSAVKSFHDGWKWAIWSPEMYGSEKVDGRVVVNANDLVDEIIWKLYGECPIKNISDKYGKKLSRSKYVEGILWVQEHFVFLRPQDRSMTGVLDCYKKAYDKRSFDGLLIDPFKNISQDSSERIDRFLEESFGECKELSLDMDVSFNIIAHPKANVETVDKDGNRAICDQYKLSGGSAWNNSMDGIYSILRPNKHRDPKDRTTNFINVKQRKQHLVAVSGTCEKIIKDIPSSRYIINGIDPFKSKEAIKFEEKPYQLPIVPNNFDKPLNPPKSMEEILKEDVKAPW